MMDVDEPVVLEPAVPETAAPEPTELLVEPEEEEEEEYEETITLKASDFVAFQDILEDMRSQIADCKGMHVRTGSRPRRCSEPF
jgi:hypothetical protein